MTLSAQERSSKYASGYLGLCTLRQPSAGTLTDPSGLQTETENDSSIVVVFGDSCAELTDTFYHTFIYTPVDAGTINGTFYDQVLYQL